MKKKMNVFKGKDSIPSRRFYGVVHPLFLNSFSFPDAKPVQLSTNRRPKCPVKQLKITIPMGTEPVRKRCRRTGSPFVDVGQGRPRDYNPNNRVMVIDGNNDDEDDIVAYLKSFDRKSDILIGTHPMRIISAVSMPSLTILKSEKYICQSPTEYGNV